MTKIYNSILDLVGHTPLLKLNKFMSSRKLEAEIADTGSLLPCRIP